MPGFNQIVLMGKLVREPILRYAGGLPVCTLRILAPRRYKGKDGTMKDDGLFINVSIWRRMAEVCSQTLQKGSEVMLSGRLQMNQWKDKNGQNRTDYRVLCQRIQFLRSNGTQSAPLAEDVDAEPPKETDTEAA